jgi:hypothetical protein
MSTEKWCALLLTSLVSACGGSKTTTPSEGSIAITISPTGATIEQGASATVTATLTRGGGFTGPVTIAVEGAPAGVTGDASNVQTTGTTTTATITITAAATAAPGSYTLQVRGRATGVTTAETSFALTVTAKPAYTLAVAPNALTIPQGGNAPASVTLNRVNFEGPVTLSLGGAPNGVGGSFNPAAPTGSTSTLTVTVGATVPAGTYNLTVNGTATIGNQSAPLTLTVTAVVNPGMIVFQSDRTGHPQVWVINPDGTGLAQLTNEPSMNSYPKWDPTREAIIFASDRSGNGSIEIYTMGAQGQNVRRQLIKSGSVSGATHPMWAPNRERFVFEDTRITPEQIFIGVVGDSNGVNLYQLTTNLNGEALRPDWSPDGTTIAYSYGPPGSLNRSIQTLPADTTRGRIPTVYTLGEEDEDPKYSPDGTMIAFARAGSSGGVPASGIYSIMVAAPFTTVRYTNGPDEEPAWSPDGRYFVFSSTRGNGQARHLYILDRITRVVRALTDSTQTGYEDHEPHWR